MSANDLLGRYFARDVRQPVNLAVGESPIRPQNRDALFFGHSRWQSTNDELLTLVVRF